MPELYKQKLQSTMIIGYSLTKEKVLEETMKDNSNNENQSIVLIVIKGEIVYQLFLNNFIINLWKEILSNLNIIEQAYLLLIISRLKNQFNHIKLQ